MSTRRKHTPTRTCTACGRVGEKNDLVRLVRTPDGDVAVDHNGKLPGRGAYVCPEAVCWQQGIEKNRIGHALKVSVSVDQAKVLLVEAKNFVRVGK